MNLNFLALAVPLFLTFMVAEYIIAKSLRKDHYFNLHSSVANISIGIAERLSDVFVTGIFYFVYQYLHQHFALFDIKPTVFLWILLLLCTDFVWYWYHRLAHEINIFWAVHVVHHQSEDFNYTTSVRITVFQAFVRTGFWCILPIIGFPAEMITILLLVHGIYPFFTHTQLVGNLGILEYIMVTPSHHRVHHASNEEYLDKNYGDVFIIWDKLFGTFQKEQKEVPITYGLTVPLKSYSFLWQHFHFIIELIVAAKKKKTFTEKLKVFFGKPMDHDPEARKKAEAIFRIQHQEGSVDGPLNKYVLLQMAGVAISLFTFVLLESYSGIWFKIAFAVFILLTLINCGAIMEQKKWIFQVEYIRGLVGIVAILSFYHVYWITVVLCLAAVVLISIFYRKLEHGYLKQVYAGQR